MKFFLSGKSENSKQGTSNLPNAQTQRTVHYTNLKQLFFNSKVEALFYAGDEKFGCRPPVGDSGVRKRTLPVQKNNFYYHQSIS